MTTTTTQDTMDQASGSEPASINTHDQPIMSKDSQRPNIEELNVQSQDEDEDIDPFVNTEESPQEPLFKIVINPTGKPYTGTSEEATLLKWRYCLGHINM